MIHVQAAQYVHAVKHLITSITLEIEHEFIYIEHIRPVTIAMTVNRVSWLSKQACKLVPVIGNFPAKFYILSDQNFLWADMWPTNLGWPNLQSQKIVYLTHFLLMKPTRKQKYSLHYFSLHESVSWFNHKSTSPSYISW